MAEWVALLRGVNVGGHHRVNMPALRSALADAGFTEVRTYVQSGNIVAESRHRSPDAVAAAVRAVVRECSGVDAPVIVRTGEQLRAVLAWNPFPERSAAEPKLVHVVHLAGIPADDDVAAVVTADWGEDAVAVRGQEAVACYADAMHSSRLQYATLLRRLKVDGTARNWRTLQALAELCRQ